MSTIGSGIFNCQPTAFLGKEQEKDKQKNYRMSKVENITHNDFFF